MLSLVAIRRRFWNLMRRKEINKHAVKNTQTIQLSPSLDMTRKSESKTENIENETEAESTKKPAWNFIPSLISAVQDKTIFQYNTSISIQPKTNTIATFKQPLKNYSKKGNQKEDKVNSNNTQVWSSSNSIIRLSNYSNQNK